MRVNAPSAAPGTRATLLCMNRHTDTVNGQGGGRSSFGYAAEEIDASEFSFRVSVPSSFLHLRVTELPVHSRDLDYYLGVEAVSITA